VSTLGPGDHTRVRRLPEKATYDAAAIFAIFDEARFCHVAAVVNGLATALPTLHAREGHTLYLHASQSNAVLRSVLAAGRATVTATMYDGLRLARSGFESSIAYRSALVVGPTREITDVEERARVLSAFVDAVLPGRASEVRPMTAREIALTLVVAVDVTEGSAKVSAGPTDDDADDAERPIWSGVVPARLVFDEPVPSRDGAMASGAVPLPASVQRLRGTDE
jgi:nitroimidazol reductase NimA-like FMN-containing flavoprotein (pyridoxamine 5'-phosphate oxidase superfamily)